MLVFYIFFKVVMKMYLFAKCFSQCWGFNTSKVSESRINSRQWHL